MSLDVNVPFNGLTNLPNQEIVELDEFLDPFMKSGKIVNPLKGTFTSKDIAEGIGCLLYTSPSPRDGLLSRMPSSA